MCAPTEDLHVMFAKATHDTATQFSFLDHQSCTLLVKVYLEADLQHMEDFENRLLGYPPWVGDRLGNVLDAGIRLGNFPRCFGNRYPNKLYAGIEVFCKLASR